MKSINTPVRNRYEKRRSRNRMAAGILAFLLIAAMVLGMIVPFLV